MASTRRTEKSSGTKRPPATTPEGRENQMINKAVALAERQLDEGTASAQVVTHYLRLGSSREKLEQEKIAYENDLLKIRAEAIAAEARVEVLYVEAIAAMRRYQGVEDPLAIEERYDD